MKGGRNVERKAVYEVGEEHRKEKRMKVYEGR